MGGIRRVQMLSGLEVVDARSPLGAVRDRLLIERVAAIEAAIRQFVSETNADLSKVEIIEEQIFSANGITVKLRFREGQCEWHEDERGLWHTQCGNVFEFYDGGPKENNFRFCPYCGRRLIVRAADAASAAR